MTGGNVIMIDSTNSGANCPAGTYAVSSPVEQYCPPCPTGYTCDGGAKTACGSGEQGHQMVGCTEPFCWLGCLRATHEC